MQAVAIPYRRTPDGLEILFVTSRKKKQWILPKGGVPRGMLPHNAAAREAMQEAGVLGAAQPEPVADILVKKRSGQDMPGAVRFIFFRIAVTTELAYWPEDYFRERKWVSLERALKIAGKAYVRDAFRSWERKIRT
ncbi:NUDIX hydrolase [Sphingobium sp. IP1]|uniref:NUDIX hydrolase n=1 Tax=Sphingobium sp. IP1 TaxID=2021637 RepID=UPI0015D5075E|nr:NUDIX hydrolase [Sphingobium sp. IP1]